MYKVIIKIARNYPHYERLTREYLTIDMAEREFERISQNLIEKVRAGEIQDYEVELSKGDAD